MSAEFLENDGGRETSGFKGTAGDCVVRAIAIACELPYQKVYDDLAGLNKAYADNARNRIARRLKEKGSTPRNGNFREVYQNYILAQGFMWVPTMKIGQGCKVHLKREELPSGRLIVQVSKHLVAVIDGVINDIYDPSREGTRCVYGYYKKAEVKS